MKKISVLISSAFILFSGFAMPVFAGARVFLHVGGGHLFFPGAAFSFHPHRSRAHLFFHLGHFGHPWGSDPGYHGPPAGLVLPYPNAPQKAFSGTDPSGAFYVQGYRVLPSGWLRIQVDPADAEVMVDGFPVSIDPTSGYSNSVGFPVGQHRVEASKTGLEPYRSEVEIKQARELVIQITLGE